MPTETIGENSGDDYSGTEDAQIDPNNVTTNYGGGDTWSMEPAGSMNKLLLSFSGLSNISSSAIVTAASINIDLAFAGASGHVIEVNRVLPDWIEGEATYTIYSTGNNWDSLGASTSGTDYSATLSTSETLDDTAGYQVFADTNLTTDFQNFIDTTWANYGWIFKRTDADSGDRYYHLQNWTDGGREFASITYTVGGWTGTINGVTDPSSVNGIAVAGITNINGVT